MSPYRQAITLVLVCCAALSASRAAAQYSAIATPFQRVGDGYYERFGVGFGGNFGNVFFNNGGMNNALPPFGGHNPADDARFGARVRGNGFSFDFGLAAGMGSDRSMTSVTPSVTIPNGGTGSIIDVQQRPFVTGLVPVVGSFSPGIGYTRVPPHMVSPVRERWARLQSEGGVPPRAESSRTPVASEQAPPRPQPTSTAERGDLSLAEIRAQRAAAGTSPRDELNAFLESAKQHEEAGEYREAITDYSKAASRGDTALQKELRVKIRELRERTTAR